MKIALIFPPSIIQTKQTMPPLGLAWIAAVLREAGYNNVIIIDGVVNNYTNDDIVNLLQKYQPDVIGVSIGTANRFHAFETVKRIKKNFPEILIVAGGPHPTLTADDTLKHISEIDIIVKGEGEYTFLELVKAIEVNGELSNVNGISYRRSDKTIAHNPTRAVIMDLDSLPLPARDLLPIEKYKQKLPALEKICTSIITSRGCPYNCVYCSTAEQWGHNIRYRSAEKVVDEMEFLIKNYKLDGIAIFDDVFTMDKKRAISICQEILIRELKFEWWCEARANTIDEELVMWLKKAGCIYIAMAIESGSDKILKNIKKAITVEQGINAAKIIRKTGIELKVFFMYGLPGENYEDIKKTVFLSKYLVNKTGASATQSLTVVYPKTELEKIAKEYGTMAEDFSWSIFFEEKKVLQPLSALESMPIFEQPYLSYKQLFKYVKRAKMVYYLCHPIYFIKSFFSNRKNIIKWIFAKTS